MKVVLHDILILSIDAPSVKILGVDQVEEAMSNVTNVLTNAVLNS